MIRRAAATQVRSFLQEFPAVVLLGPRQVGKTTLALAVGESLRPAAAYVDLESPSGQSRLADPESYFAAHEDRLVILDEVQRMPGLFQILRGAIDAQRRRGDRAGKFLLLGSASIDLLSQSSESLAGRVASVELTPILADEAPASSREQQRLWVRGGFPDSLLASSDAASLRWRQQFIGTCLERDVPNLGPRIPAATLRRFWTMLAHSQGSLLNAAAIASALGLSGQTVARYLDLMVDLLLVRRLAPWSSNVGKRLVKSPKVYVRDSGLVHALLGLPDLDGVLGHPVAGGSWEGFVIESLIAAAPSGSEAWFFRSSAGAEIDLVLEPSPRDRWAIEVKRSSAPVLSRGFHLACSDIKATRRLVIYPGEEAYSLGEGIEATPLVKAMSQLRQLR